MAKIVAITGPMYAGKTTKLQEELSHYDDPIAVKPSIDNRYGEDEITSHDGHSIPAFVVRGQDDNMATTGDNTYRQILDLVDEHDPDALGIDEAQFFDYDIAYAAAAAQKTYGVDVYISGLSEDFRGLPFRPMSDIIQTADELTELTADCDYRGCGEEATRTQRLIDGEPAPFDSPVIEVGGQELYEARCNDHHDVPRS